MPSPSLASVVLGAAVAVVIWHAVRRPQRELRREIERLHDLARAHSREIRRLAATIDPEGAELEEWLALPSHDRDDA